MNSNEIADILNTEIPNNFGGVLAFNHVEVYKIHFAYVINTDECTEPGTHWVCVYSNNGVLEFFDSSGLSPKTQYGFLNNFIYSTKQIQGIFASTCGPYCIAYILYRIIFKKTFKQFLNYFTSNLGKNDINITKFMRVNFGLNLPIYR